MTVRKERAGQMLTGPLGQTAVGSEIHCSVPTQPETDEQFRAYSNRSVTIFFGGTSSRAEPASTSLD